MTAKTKRLKSSDQFYFRINRGQENMAKNITNMPTIVNTKSIALAG